jgi:nucleotide-binding universal stress UspA family protein
MKKILVPTDFSKVAQIAANVAGDIALKSYGKLVLLHVIEQPGNSSFAVSGEVDSTEDWDQKIFTAKLIEKSKSQLAKIANDLKEKGVRVTQEIRMGNAYHGIATIITEHNVDLVVMGTSGHSRLEEMIIGSVTEKVIRNTNCPVLTIHGKPGNLEYKNIVYATSMADDERDFAKVVKTAQKMYDSTVHVVRINTPNNFQPDFVVEKVMTDFAKKVKLENFTLNTYNDYSEEEGIIHFAESIDADLIAMSTHGRKGFAHVLVGSVAEDVANHAKRPVLTFINK